MTEFQYPVMEQFYTVQGEGAFSGAAAYFIRLAGCDVGCVWCDVKESWNAEGHPQLTATQLAATAVKSGANMVVITGGEPAMYDLTELIGHLKAQNLQVHIETSAAYPIVGVPDWITISPKKFKFPVTSELVKAHELKVIVFNKSDLNWAQSFETQVNKQCKLLLQPEWDKREQVLPMIVDFVKKNPRWNISLQTHKYIGVP